MGSGKRSRNLGSPRELVSARVAGSVRRLVSMKATQTTNATTEHPPLARDNRGQLVPIPDGTAAWRISRQTGGRPRIIHGPDKQPARFGLETTPEELLDMCGPDTYRVHALDEVGQVIDHVTTLDIGPQLRNAAGPEIVETTTPANTNAAAPTSEMQRAIETMTSALADIAKTNGEALRAVAESQADWIKSLAQAKGGLLRNVGLPEWFVRDRVEERRRDRDDDEDDDEQEAPEPPAPSESGLDKFLGMVTPLVPNLMAEWRGPKQPANDTGHVMRQLAKLRRMLTPDERQLLDEVIENDPQGDAIAEALATKPIEDVLAMIRKPRPDALIAQLRAKAMAVIQCIDGPLKVRLMKLGMKLQSLQTISPELRAMIEEIQPLSVEQTAAWLETHIDELERRFS